MEDSVPLLRESSTCSYSDPCESKIHLTLQDLFYYYLFIYTKIFQVLCFFRFCNKNSIFTFLLFLSLSLCLSVSCTLHVPARSHPLRSVHHYSTWRSSSEGIAERETTWKQKRTATSLRLIVIPAFKIPCAIHIIKS